MPVPLHTVPYGSSGINIEVVGVGFAEERCRCSIFMRTYLRVESFRALSRMRHVRQGFIDMLLNEWQAYGRQVL
jgi:hypothetical protein